MNSRIKPHTVHALTPKLNWMYYITHYWNKLINTQFYCEISIRNVQRYAWPLSLANDTLLSSCWCRLHTFAAMPKAVASVSLKEYHCFLDSITAHRSLCQPKRRPLSLANDTLLSSCWCRLHTFAAMPKAVASVSLKEYHCFLYSIIAHRSLCQPKRMDRMKTSPPPLNFLHPESRQFSHL
jgi:hypothetical protein